MSAVEGWVKLDEVREHFDSVGCGTIYKNGGEGRVPLYTTSQQRKPLTDGQINAIWDSLIASPDYSREMIVRAIEAAHGIKEKNT